MDEIDRYLASEQHEPPPISLAARVMRAVRREARRPDPIAFPWTRFALGLAAGALVCVLLVVEGREIAARLFHG